MAEQAIYRRPSMHIARPAVEVFAVEDDSVQIVWTALPADETVFEAGGRRVEVRATRGAWLRRRHRPALPLPGTVMSSLRGRPRTANALIEGYTGTGWSGPGAAVITGLAPSTRYDLTMAAAGVPRRVVASFSTLAPPSGRQLAKVATVSDMHIGERSFGVSRWIEDRYPLRPDDEAYALACARAALEEAVAWGADLIVVKGDLTRKAEPVEFEEVGRLLGSCPVDLAVTFGNHEHHDTVDGRPILARHGVVVSDQPWYRDVDGLRIVLGHSSEPGNPSGHVSPEQLDALCDMTASAPGAAMLALHHHFQRWHLPNQYPPGIPGPQARRILGRLGEANPATIVVSGHTHRNRRHAHGPLAVSEVGSTKDYPGQWAGYAVHEGGIRQVVRRISAPDAIAWTDATYWSLWGVWGHWSPGSLSQRCFSHTWPARP